MTANLKQFNRDLDRLLARRLTKTSDPALQTATLLLALDLEAEAVPSADLRARWAARTGHIPTTTRKPFMQTVRTRPFAAILIALLILLLISGAAYALGRVLGFIPGIGMVEQTPELRALETPQSVERDGIRLTILNAIASPTGTSVRFQVEWLTPPPSSGDFDTSCQGTPGLALTDGTLLNFVQTKEKFGVGQPGSNTGYGYVMEFAPVPAGQNDVIFVYPCLVPLIPGPLPRDWNIPLHLIPAPEGMVLPVLTMPATASPIIPATEMASPSNPPAPVNDPTHRIASSIDSVVPMDDGYLLLGSMQWSANDYPAYGVRPVAFTGYVNVTDANGQAVPWEEAFGAGIPRNEEFRSYWAIKILSKSFAAPLTITLNAADAKIQPIPFTFEVGAAPQAGQSWDVNQDLQIAGSHIQIQKATLVSSETGLNFQFDMQVDPNVIGDVYLSTPLNQCNGGGGGYPTEHLSQLNVYMPMCRSDVPAGSVDVQAVEVVLWGQWQVAWQP